MGSAIAVARQALVGTLGSCSPPRPIVEERQALFTVNSVCVMLAVAHELPKLVLYTLTGMSITFTPATHSKVRDCIIVRLEDFGVIEYFISKGVQAIECDSDVSGCHPFL